MTENPAGKKLPTPTDRRDQFLLIMYGKMWDNINRHLTVVWQSSAVLAGATAVFALVERGALTLDIASSLLMLVAGWMVLHAYDANGWYNRNLGIIANIERQFLEPTDLKDIQYFFSRHRSSTLVEHLQIHAMLGVGFAVLTLAYHLSIRVWPGRHSPIENFEPERLLPYVMATIVAGVVLAFRSHYLNAYQQFESKSPGIAVRDVTLGPTLPP